MSTAPGTTVARRQVEPVRPFRWDLAGGAQLGTLPDGVAEPQLRFLLPNLIECAAKVLARSGNGRMFFVGRSADSVYDLLSGALAATPHAGRLYQLPFSLREGLADLGPGDVKQLRANLSDAGISPRTLAAAGPPTVFVDLLYCGYTFTNLFDLLRAWAAEQNAPWDVIRHKIRFCGITNRTKTSPKTWRWYQHLDWARDLPASATVSVSIDRRFWSYLGNDQAKLTASFGRGRWASEAVRIPAHDDKTRAALAEAIAIVEAGRAAPTRRTLARVLAEEPAFAQPWLRTLARQISR